MNAEDFRGDAHEGMAVVVSSSVNGAQGDAALLRYALVEHDDVAVVPAFENNAALPVELSREHALFPAVEPCALHGYLRQRAVEFG